MGLLAVLFGDSNVCYFVPTFEFVVFKNVASKDVAKNLSKQLELGFNFGLSSYYNGIVLRTYKISS